MRVGNMQAAAMLLASFALLAQSYGPDYLGLGLKFIMPLTAFSAVSALIAKIALKAEISDAAIVSFNAYSVFIFVLTCGIALVGLFPAGILWKSWLAPVLLACAITFASWALFAHFHLSGLAEISPKSALGIRIAVFAAGAIAAAASAYLLVPISAYALAQMIPNV